ncbi:hypothetical protein NYE67_20695 [Solibacillus sp. FSL W8-0474]|uniref:hypothetical protein n=1 Tax=Solibacillus sp. FSL W8-0474 TaxID=2975336 RepID=UPI0030FC60D0
MGEAMDEIYRLARHTVLTNPGARYIILSTAAFRHLRSLVEDKHFWVNSKKQLLFMGKEIAIVEDHDIVIEIGG